MHDKNNEYTNFSIFPMRRGLQTIRNSTALINSVRREVIFKRSVYTKSPHVAVLQQC